MQSGILCLPLFVGTPVCALHAGCLDDNWQPYPRHDFSLCCRNFPGDESYRYVNPYRSVMI